MNSSATDNLAPGIAAPVEAPASLGAPAVSTDVLILGYGNTMRGDDGVGPAVATRLGGIFHDASYCRCTIAHQLAPEHTDELARARRVLFIDASVQVPAGEVRITPLTPNPSPSHSLTHHVAPQTLLWMSQQFFGHAPRAWSVEIGVADLSVGERLSPAVAKAATRLVRQLARYLRLSSTPAGSSASPDASKEASHV